MCKRLKKGFTLVELVVVLVLMGLITTAIAMVLRPTTSLYIDVNNKTNEEIAAITLFDVLNGELRYSTDIRVYSAADDTIFPADTVASLAKYNHFIMLSNGLRDGNHLDAHGYVKHGYTAHGIIGAGYVGNSDALLENTDIKFSIDGYSAAAGKQSITIGAVMHPMNTKGIMKEKEYKYSETFKLVNMQHKDQLTGITVENIDMVDYDAAAVQDGINGLLNNNNTYTGGEQVIYIFYQRPEEAPSTVSSTSISTSTTFQPFTATRGDKKIDLGAVTPTNKYKVRVQSGDQTVSNLRVTFPETAYYVDSTGNMLSNGYIDLPVDEDLSIEVTQGTDDPILFTINGTDTIEIKDSDFTSQGTTTLYVQHDGSAWDKKKDAQADGSDNKAITLHYVHVAGDPYGGVLFEYDASSEGHKTQVGTDMLTNGGSVGFVTSGEGIAAQDIVIMRQNTSLNLFAYDGSSRYGNIGNLTNASDAEYWVCFNGSTMTLTNNKASLPSDGVAMTSPSLNIDPSSIAVSGDINQYNGYLIYTIPVTNNGYVDVTNFTIDFSFAGSLNNCWSVGATPSGTCAVNKDSRTVKLNVSDIIPVGATKEYIISINGSTGTPTTNLSDYAAQGLTCTAN